MTDPCGKDAVSITDAVIGDKEVTLTENTSQHPFDSWFVVEPDFCNVEVKRLVDNLIESFVNLDETNQRYTLL